MLIFADKKQVKKTDYNRFKKELKHPGLRMAVGNEGAEKELSGIYG